MQRVPVTQVLGGIETHPRAVHVLSTWGSPHAPRQVCLPTLNRPFKRTKVKVEPEKGDLFPWSHWEEGQGDPTNP